MKRKTIDIITLGCSKNLVDSEHLMRQLEEAGYHVTHDTEKPEGEIAVINTCGFIGDAKEESINMILEFAQAKEEGDLEKLYVIGCLSERYLKELAIEIPQVDKFYGKFNWVELLQDLGKAYHEEFHIERTLTTPKHYAYLKISEGCDRKCSYCAIPIITGKHVSRPMEEILDALNMPDTINPIYRERLWDFVFYPQITYEVESRYLGIYQRRKTVIKGIGLGMITGKEEEYIKSRQK